MRIERISRETHPEEFEILDKMEECRRRGHGKWVTNSDGVVECHECGGVIFCRTPYEDLDCVDCEGPNLRCQ